MAEGKDQGRYDKVYHPPATGMCVEVGQGGLVYVAPNPKEGAFFIQFRRPSITEPPPCSQVLNVEGETVTNLCVSYAAAEALAVMIMAELNDNAEESSVWL